MAKETRIKKPDSIVIQNITIRSANRKSQDIENWRQAIKQFENLINPSRVLLYDLYEDITLDGQIESTWGKRLDNITNKDLLFVRNGEEDEKLNKLLNSPTMREMLKELLNSIAWGYTLIQINNIFYDVAEEQYVVDWDLIPRKHVHPERGFECISFEQNYAARDILFKDLPLSRYMLWAGNPKDMGIFVKAAQYVIYKRGDFGDWAQFAEMFGMPFREARYNGYDEDTRIKLEQAMAEYGGNNYAVLPEDAKLTIHENKSQSGSSDLYSTLKDACNTEISKIILGNTLTTEQGTKGTQALGTVHKDTEDQKKKADEKFIIDILNGKFRAILKTFGFDVQGGQIWFRSPDKDWTQLQIKWNIIKGISDVVPVDDDFIYEEFDVPKPKDYARLKDEKKQSSLYLPVHAVDNKENKPLVQRIYDFFV